MEILDLYDDNCKKLNEKITRGEELKTGKNVMLSVIYIKNKENKYLIQKTSKTKGGKYSSTGGHVVQGEDGFTTIKRELNEELGINPENDDIKFATTFKYPNKNCVFNVYKLQESEVESVLYLNKEEIEKIINEGNFLESHAYIFKNYIIK